MVVISLEKDVAACLNVFLWEMLVLYTWMRVHACKIIFSIIDFIHSIVGRIVGFTNAIILQIKDFIEGVGKMT